MAEQRWKVTYGNQARKQVDKLPPDIRDNLYLLQGEMEAKGPERADWPHYGKIKGRKKGDDYRHCHLNKGKPTYVAVWRVADMALHFVEFRYVGPHENANYQRIG